MTETNDDLVEQVPDRLFFKPLDVAVLFNVSVKTVYAWIDQGKLDAVRVAGHTVRIPRRALQAIIDDMG